MRKNETGYRFPIVVLGISLLFSIPQNAEAATFGSLGNGSLDKSSSSGSATMISRLNRLVDVVEITKSFFGVEANAVAMALPPAIEDPQGGGTTKDSKMVITTAGDADINKNGVNGIASAISTAENGLIFDEAKVMPLVTNFSFAGGFARSATTHDVGFKQGPVAIQGSSSPTLIDLLLEVELKDVSLEATGRGRSFFNLSVNSPELGTLWRASISLTSSPSGSPRFKASGDLSSDAFNVTSSGAFLPSYKILIPLQVEEGEYRLNTDVRGRVRASVPEPLTILGSATAIGFGALLKRKQKLSKSLEKETVKVS
jgi:hypothetical protein